MTTKENEHALQNAKGWLESIHEMVAKLTATADDEGYRAREEAEEAIRESILSVQVRDGWYDPGRGETGDKSGPEEFEILLTTGGPALRIIGTLDSDADPECCRLQWQDWGTYWTDYHITGKDGDALRRFASCFYFGE